MLNPDLRPTNAAPEAHAPLRSGSHDAVLAELSSILFTSFSRSDQCRKGMQYLRGLLETQGRKSIRNIAATLLGERISEQNLHHFISDSTWDWVPLRRALAHHLMSVSPPQAWVVQPIVIPKAGRHSVGVDKHFFPGLGQVLNAQRAVGVWAVSQEATAPVNWRLHLPKAWLKDDLRRSQVSIPDGADVETLSECVTEAFLESMTEWQLPIRPVVINSCETQALAVFEKLGSTGIPLLVKASGDLRLTTAGSGLPAHGGRPLSAYQIMNLVKEMRRPVIEKDPDRETAHQRCFTAAVRVCVPTPPGQPGDSRELLLLGVGEEGEPWPACLWLTNLTTTSPAALTRLIKLTEKVNRDFAEISDRVGIRDFTGRSFSGWHRHVTLASAAHAVVSLADQDR
ncbi:IS701 family transposase [Streptomyces abikoensis]|uniref:IS701 family transposase n=1 Tax=Streptomyces abikoensis TaxID=97398 RepID=UPI00371679C0